MIDLNAEWSSCRYPMPMEAANLRRLGIDLTATVHSPGGGLLVVNAEASGELWQPMPDGRKLLVIACDLAVDENGTPEIVDLLAFDPREPSRWWLRRGVAHWLAGWEVDRRTAAGNWTITPPITADGRATFDALPIWRNPLSWLQNGCIGAVPLTAEALEDLRQIDPPVICEDFAHAEEIERALLTFNPSMPLLKLPVPAGVAA
jgi:hypothetical protein